MKRLFVKWILRRNRADLAINELKANPARGKPLRVALSGKWSWRFGDYRIIYVIDETEKTVTLYDVRHRHAVYK